MASILVIDDDRAVLGTFKLLLERAAHAVEAVDNSQAGLRLLETLDLLTGAGFLHMATKLGAISNLQKPFRPQELLAAVTKSLSDSLRSSRPAQAT